MIRGIQADRTGIAGARSQRRDAAGWLHPASWVAFGFLAGVVFWHLVGFWDFVSKAVFRTGPDAPVTVTAKAVVPPPVKPLVAGNARTPAGAHKPSCVVLVLDRIGGATRQAACPAKTFHHRNGGVGIKRDRERPIRPENAGGLAGWSTQLAPQMANPR